MADASKVRAAAVVAVIGVIGLGIYVKQKDDGHSPSAEGPGAVCALTSAAFLTIATELTHGATAQEIVKMAFPVAATLACTSFVSGLVKSPTKPAPVTFNFYNIGTQQQVTASAFYFQKPAERAPTCDDWLLIWAKESCKAGRLTPPRA